MSRSLGVLTLDLIAKTGGFVAGMSKAERASAEWRKSVEKNVKATATAVAAAGTAFAAFAVYQTKSAIDSADALSKQAKSVGIAVEGLGALNYAAELSGVSVDELSGGLNRFNRSVDDAAAGIGAGAEAFDTLNVSVLKTDGSLKSNYDLIEELSDAFAGMQDGARKSALAQDLFGRSGAKLIPLLNGGSDGLASMAEEAEGLGLIIDTKTAVAAEEFNDNLTRLQKASTALGTGIAKDLLPSLVRITTAMVDARRDSGVLYAAFVGLGGVGAELVGLNDQLTVLNREIERLENISAVAEQNPLSRLLSGFSADEIAKASKSLVELRKQRDQLLLPPSKTPPGEDGSTPSGPSEEFQKREAQLRKEASLYGEVGKAAQLRYEIENGLIKGLLPGEGEHLIKLQQQLDARSAATKAIEDQKRAQEQLSESLASELTALERAAVTWGMNADEVKLYDLVMQGANDTQLDIARSLLNTVSGLEQQREAQEAYVKLVADLRTEEERRSGTLREQLAILEAIAGVPTPEIQEQRSRAAAGAFEESPNFEGLAPEVGGVSGELAKLDDAERELDDWYDSQLERLKQYREDEADLNAEWDEQELALKQQHEDALANIEAARRLTTLKTATEIFDNLAVLTESKNKNLFRIGKAAASASAVVSGAQIFLNALSIQPYPVGVVLAATSAIATAAQIAKINGAQFKDGGYTGNYGINDIVGQVHGQEYVFNAEATKRIGVANLDAMANGKLDRAVAAVSESGRNNDQRPQSSRYPALTQHIHVTGAVDRRTAAQLVREGEQKRRMYIARLG